MTPKPDKLGALKKKMLLDEAKASVTLDGETQSNIKPKPSEFDEWDEAIKKIPINKRPLAGRELRNNLSPEWIRDVCMFDKKRNALVISPMYLQERGVSNIIITHNRFGSSECMKIKTDFADRRGNDKL